MIERELCHHGIKGQKWGVRRFQNKDGTWTKEGIQRWSNNGGQTVKTDQTKQKNDRIKKVALAVGVTAATAALAYYGVKKYKDVRNSSVIEKGKESVSYLSKDDMSKMIKINPAFSDASNKAKAPTSSNSTKIPKLTLDTSSKNSPDVSSHLQDNLEKLRKMNERASRISNDAGRELDEINKKYLRR